MALRVTCQDHHFASSVETTYFRCRPPADKKIDELFLEISDRTGAVIHKQQWSAGTLPADGKYAWDGEKNQVAVTDDQGKPAKKYATPLGSPYKATFRARLSPARKNQTPPSGISATSSGEKETCPLKRKALAPREEGTQMQDGTAVVKVLYREVKFETVTWLEIFKAVTGLPDGSFPSAGTPDEKKLWLAYKLNELGYLAGPVQTPPDDGAIQRALFRYTQAHPEILPKIHDFHTCDHPKPLTQPATWRFEWKVPWESQFGTLTEVCERVNPAGDDLLDRLEADEQKRADVIEKASALSKRKESTRIILDHNIFYINSDTNVVDAHAEYDREFLNPFCWPFRAVIRLVSQKDSAATKAGVDAPKALDSISLDWFVYDPPEDKSIVPEPTKANVRRKSKTRAYIGTLHRKLAPRDADEANALDNCPAHLGGNRPSDPADMSGFFEPVQNPDAFPGSNLIHFKGSYIGGDNFVVQARLSLDGVDGAGAIKADHRELSGLKDSFAEPKLLASSDPDDPLVAQTGDMTVWRRHRVLRELKWGSQPCPDINWPPVVANFKAAHIILVPPTEPGIHIGDLFSDTARKAIVAAIAGSPAVTELAKKEFDARKGEAAFQRDAVFPLPFRKLDNFETSEYKKGDPSQQTSQERFKNYTEFLDNHLKAWPKYDSMVDMAREIRKAFDDLKKGAGLLVLRTEYLPKPDFKTLLPDKVFKATQAEQASFKYVRGIATGMDYGVVILDAVNAAKYEESYFVSHEIGHCMFFVHPHDGDRGPMDHDEADKNCMMYYNTTNTVVVDPQDQIAEDGAQEGWAIRNAPDRFKVEIQVEFDKTLKVECGTFSSKFVRGGKTPRGREFICYTYEGKLNQVQKVLQEAKFSPAKELPDTRSTIELKLLGAPGLVSPKFSLGKSPCVVRVNSSGGSTRPFAKVTLTAPKPGDCEPRFCGKCVLKLRGWRVAGPAQSPAAPVPVKSRAAPSTGRMVFKGYFVNTGSVTLYVGGSPKPMTFGLDVMEPPGSTIRLGPFSFGHSHNFFWESNTGDLADLAGIWTREFVRFKKPTQSPPFNVCADPDQEFAQWGGGGADGFGHDMHSVRLPALICQRVPGTIIGEQWYQYSYDGKEWVNMPDSAFILEKSVYRDNDRWVIMFKKTNRAPDNPVPYHFEVHYRIGPLLLFQPDTEPHRFAAATKDKPVIHPVGAMVPNALIWAAGQTTMRMDDEKLNWQEVTPEELKQKGFLISGTPPPS